MEDPVQLPDDEAEDFVSDFFVSVLESDCKEESVSIWNLFIEKASKCIQSHDAISGRKRARSW